MVAPTVYKNTDTSAPVLTGQAGSLISLLDACLVNGYGSKAAAGWTKAFSGTNHADYLGAVGHYLDVTDDASGAAGGQEAFVRGYESMTALGTGTNPFPTTSQRTGTGLWARKSSTADTAARAWVLIADDRTFYLFVLTGDTVGHYKSIVFGRFYSFVPGDSYRSILMAHNASGGTANDGLDISALQSSAAGNTTGMFVARPFNGTVGALQSAMYGVGSATWTSPWAGPNPSDSNVYLSRLLIGGTTDGLRGYLRGVYQLMSGLNDGDTFSGTGDFAGRSFLALNGTGAGGVIAIETTAWDSSS